MSLKKKALIIIAAFISMIMITISLFLIYIFVIPIEIDLEKLNTQQVNVSIYDIEMNKINTQDDKYVKYEEIPKDLINAFIAIEDKRFFKHNGIDLIRIIGAAKNNLLYKSYQGGSTITQQLIKNTYLTSDKSINRKIKEIRMAIQLEKKYSKEEILEKYLNMLYFGSGVYGIKNASARFFSKSLNELNINECALLAGIIKSPTKYNPINNLDNSIDRMSIVLKQLKNQNFITNSEYLDAKNTNIIIKNDLNYNNIAAKYSENVYFEASKLLNIDSDILPYLDINIYTYFDKNTQNVLIDSLTNESFKLEDNQSYLGMIIDNKSCGISAYYSNNDFNPYLFLRSPGSTIKPFAVFAPALEDNCHLFTKFNNLKTSFDGYSPSNYKDNYTNFATIEDSLCYSYNVSACETLDFIGINKAKSILDQMNIPYEKEDLTLSLALGGMTYGINFLDLASAYTCFANDGYYSKPRFIHYITHNDNVVYKNKLEKNKIFSDETSSLINIALEKCAKIGTASKLSTLDIPIASKTGTVAAYASKKNTDIYNLAYTKDVTSLFWCGSLNKDGYLDEYITGGGLTTCMAKEFYRNFYKENKPDKLYISNNIKKIYLDKISYENNEYLTSSLLTPSPLKVPVFINTLKNDLKEEDSYTNIDNLEIDTIFNNGIYSLEFNSNERIRYKVFKKSNLNVELIKEINNTNKRISIPINEKDQYIVIPYYLNDGEEIIGTPKKVILR